MDAGISRVHYALRHKHPKAKLQKEPSCKISQLSAEFTDVTGFTGAIKPGLWSKGQPLRDDQPHAGVPPCPLIHAGRRAWRGGPGLSAPLLFCQSPWS